MERKIGEIFEYNGEWYQCVKSPDGSCKHCDMNFGGKCPIPTKECMAILRSDLSYVIFKKLEKVGEPYEFDGHLFQSYRTFEVPIFTENYATVRELGDNSKISIEIKQTIKDMEENNGIQPRSELYSEFPKGTASNTRHLAQENKSVSEKLKEYFSQMSEEQLEKDFDLIKRFNESGVSVDDFLKSQESVQMKPFDFEAAKSGKPVYTRDGRKARIICFDRISGDYYEIVACVTTFDGDFEEVLFYGIDGYIVDSQNPKDADLMMLPEKKEGWAVIFKDNLLRTEKEARELAEQSISEVIRIEKIEWEE